jgi:quercetin dioxygenase-like cupin family protein
MQLLNPRQAVQHAVSGNPGRPATAIVLDTADVRLVVFRILPGQAVPPHTSTSAVVLTILEGSGFLTGSGGATACTAGDVACYQPKELHGMRANGSELHVLAAITPRPGERAAPTDQREEAVG